MPARHEIIRIVATTALVLVCAFPASAHDGSNDQLIPGGGSEATDCMVQFFGGDLNYPVAPKAPKEWRCYDGDATCDQSPAGDGACAFAVGVCLNGTGHAECTPSDVASVTVKNKKVGDPKYDAGLGTLQTSIDALGLPTTQQNLCTLDPAIVNVPLKSGGKPGKGAVQLKSISTPSLVTDKVTKDNDKLKLRCEACPANGTFDNLARFVFDGGCSTGFCHVSSSPTGGLILEPASAHAELVGVTPSNATAAGAGKKLVDPGHPENSFILDKLCGADPGNPALRPAVCAGHDLQIGLEGSPMPPPTGGLSEAKVQLIHDWIAAGAPATGWVPGTHCGVPPDVVEPIAQPPVPPGGFQLELPPFPLGPGQEIEGCMWVQVPLVAPLDVSAIEIQMNEGSHHFILFRNVDDGNPATPPPTTGVWDPTDTACLGAGGFQENLSGSQDPYNIDVYPDGLARTIHPGDYIGLNSHYINTFNVPIEGHVYINFYPYAGTEPHKTAKTLFATDANFGTSGIGVFGPGIPPFTIGTTVGNWTNPESAGACIVGLTSHMHKRGTVFTEEYPVGNQIYYSNDWDHPVQLPFVPPLWVPQGDVIRYTCQHDNGFSNPALVKRNAFGQASALKFGASADDEMCIMPGLYFVPDAPGDCTLP